MSGSIRRIAAGARRNGIALLALGLGIGGGSAYAAITIPPHSVGTSQLRPDAVVSSRVKDHSLLARDFASGQGERGGVRPQLRRGGGRVDLHLRRTRVDTPGSTIALEAAGNAGNYLEAMVAFELSA